MSYASVDDEFQKDLSADEDDSGASPLLETYWSAHSTTVNVVQELEPRADVPLPMQGTYWATHSRNESDNPPSEEVWLQEPDSETLKYGSIQQETGSLLMQVNGKPDSSNSNGKPPMPPPKPDEYLVGLLTDIESTQAYSADDGTSIRSSETPALQLR